MTQPVGRSGRVSIFRRYDLGKDGNKLDLKEKDTYWDDTNPSKKYLIKAEVNAPWHGGFCYLTLRGKILQFQFSYHIGSDNFELDLAKKENLMKLTNKETMDGWTHRSDTWKSWANTYGTKTKPFNQGSTMPVGPLIFCKSHDLVDPKDPKKGYK